MKRVALALALVPMMMVSTTVLPMSLAAQSEERPLTVGGAIKAPRRIKTVAPVYPSGAASGTSVLELGVDPAGHVARVRALRSVQGATDAAVTAVRQWEYEPLVYEGKPAWFNIVVMVPSPWRE